MKKDYFVIDKSFAPDIFLPQKEFYLQTNKTRKKTKCKVLTNFGDSIILINLTKGFKPFIINISDVGHFKKFMFYTKSHKDVTNTSVESAKWNLQKLTPGQILTVQRYNDNIKDYNQPIDYEIVTCTDYMLSLESNQPKKQIFIMPHQVFSKKTFRIL